MSYESFIKRLQDSKEFYFIDTFEEVVFKSSPKGYEQKRKGGEPSSVQVGSKLLTEALFEAKEITKEEYLKY
jgi:hypothetical protein